MYEFYHEKNDFQLSSANMMLNLLVSFKHNSKNLDRTLDFYPYRTNQLSVKNIMHNEYSSYITQLASIWTYHNNILLTNIEVIGPGNKIKSINNN